MKSIPVSILHGKCANIEVRDQLSTLKQIIHLTSSHEPWPLCPLLFPIGLLSKGRHKINQLFDALLVLRRSRLQGYGSWQKKRWFARFYKT